MKKAKEVEVIELNIDSIVPHPKNPKKHWDEGIVASIQDKGYIELIVVDEKNRLLAGEGRWRALKKLGHTTIKVIRKEGLTEKQKLEYLIASNKLTERGGWDADILKTFDIDVLQAGGLQSFEIDKLFEKDMKEDGFDVDAEILAEITAINGMTKEIVEAEGRSPVACLGEFVEFVRHGAVAHLTHNGIRFDIPFLEEQVRQVLGDTLPGIKKRALDTAVFFKAGEMEMHREWNETFAEWADRVMNTRIFGLKYNLGLCCEKLGVDKTKVQQHRALGDVELTHLVYQKIIA